MGIDPSKIDIYLGDEFVVEAGVAEFSGPEAQEVILGELAALAFPEAGDVGDELSLAGVPFKVVGKIGTEAGFDRIVSNAVVVPLKGAQSAFHQTGTVSALLITAPGLGEVGPLAERIREVRPLLSVITLEEMAESIDDALAGQRQFFAIINNTAYIVAATIVLIVMVMSVAERTREIGTMRALGASRGVVLSTVVLEAAALGLLGGVISLPAAYVLDKLLEYGLAEVANIVDLVRVVIVVSVLSAVFALLPAVRAMRISPVEALQYE